MSRPLYRTLETELISVSLSLAGLVSRLCDGERGRRRLLPGLQPDDGHKQHRGLQVCNRGREARD